MVANINVVNGTTGADVLYGDLGIDNLINGFGSSGDPTGDEIHTGDGNDTVYGGDAAGDVLTIYNDTADALIYLGAGADTVYGGSGTATIYGSTGGDTVYGGAGNMVFFGNTTATGADQVIGGSGDDIILGGAGGDTLVGGGGSDFISGGAGDSTIYSHQGRVTKPVVEKDLMYGGAGTNQFYLECNYLGGKAAITPAREGKFKDGSYAVIEDFKKGTDTLGLLNNPSVYNFNYGNYNGVSKNGKTISDTFISYNGNTVAIVLDTRLTSADVVKSPAPTLV